MYLSTKRLMLEEGIMIASGLSVWPALLCFCWVSVIWAFASYCVADHVVR
jgi:hypothetical protein